jgi:hypothetical protein
LGQTGERCSALGRPLNLHSRLTCSSYFETPWKSRRPSAAVTKNGHMHAHRSLSPRAVNTLSSAPRLGLIFLATLLFNLSIAHSTPPDPATIDSDQDGVADAIERVDGTGATDVESYVEHNLSGKYCLDWNGYLDNFMQVLELRNTGCGALSTSVTMINAEGIVQGAIHVPLSAGAENDLIVNQLSGFSPLSYGNICVSVDSGENPDKLNVQMSTYSLTPDRSSFAFAFAEPFTGIQVGPQFVGFNHYFPTLNFEELNKFVESYVQVSSYEAVAETGLLIYYDVAGNEIKRTELTIPPNGRLDVDTHSVGPDTVGLVEWLPNDTSAKFHIALNRYYHAGARPDAPLAGAVSLAARRGSGHRTAAAFDTRSQESVLELSETSGQTVSMTISVFDQAGTPTTRQPGTITLSPKSTRHIVLNQYLAYGIGKVQIEPNIQLSVIAELLEYRQTDAGQFVSASAGELRSGFGPVAEGSFNDFLGGCRARLANISAAPISIGVGLNDSSGGPLTLASPVTIPGNGVSEIDLCSAAPSSSYGRFFITPPAAETITGSIIRTNLDTTAALRSTVQEQGICTAGLTLNPPSLSITSNGGTGDVTVTNTSDSVTATDIQTMFPAGLSDVTADAGACASLAPHVSCTIHFTSGASTHGTSLYGVQGSNSKLADLTFAVTQQPTATLVAGSPLVLITNNAGQITVTNTSTTVTAVDVDAHLDGTALDGNVTVTSGCSTILPMSSCSFTFQAGSGAVAATDFPIFGSNTDSTTGNITVTTPVVLSLNMSSLSLLSGGQTGDLVVTNTSSTVTATQVQIDLLSGLSDVLQDASDCSSIPPNGSCTIHLTSGASGHATASYDVQGTNTAATPFSLTVVPSTTLSTSVSSLALAVNDSGTHAALTGTARVIVITNLGLNDALSVGYSASSSLPTGTTINSTCGTLSSGASCNLTITPGATPSAAVGDTAAAPITLSISGSNTNTVTADVSVLTYGSVYQGGYLFSVDDTTPSTTAIGGKVLQLSDQSSGILWSSDTGGMYDGGADIGLSNGSSIPCVGNSEGKCNTAQITAHYAGVNNSYYAAGLCQQTIAGFSDWYLPAICEWGYDAASVGSGCGTVGAPLIQNIQSNLIDSSAVGLSLTYWTSTEAAGFPADEAWVQVSSSPFNAQSLKSSLRPVRCVRDLS